MSKKQPTRGESLAKAIISEYKPKTVEDMQNALKDVFGPMFEAMENASEEDVFQAMEALVYNLNSMHSRAGAQVPFSSLNMTVEYISYVA